MKGTYFEGVVAVVNTCLSNTDLGDIDFVEKVALKKENI